MRLLFIKLIIFLAVLKIASPELIAQDNIGNPLEPEPERTQREIGLILGGGQNMQYGSYKMIKDTNCDCEFSGGVKTGFTFGAVYLQDIKKKWSWGVALTYDLKNINSSYKAFERVSIQSLETGAIDSADMWFRNTANANFSYLSAMPFIEWRPFQDIIFVRLGVMASGIVSSNIHQEKSLIDNQARINGELDNVTLADGGNTAVIREEAFPNLSAFQLSLVPTAGFNIYLTRFLFASPMFQYSLPLTNIVGGTDFKIASWRINLEVRLALALRTK